MAFVEDVTAQRCRITAGLAQLVHQCVQPRLRRVPGARLARVGVHHQVQPALEVVEHRQLFGQHQVDVRGAQFVALVAAGQARLDVADALEAEPADQAAGEAGQAIELGHRIGRAQRLDLGKGVFDLARFHHLAVLAHFHGVAAEGDRAPGRQADDRVAAETLAALDRFEQVGVRGVGQLQVHRQRRVQVRKDLAHDRDTGVQAGAVAVSGVLVELFGRNQGGLPSGGSGRGGG